MSLHNRLISILTAVILLAVCGSEAFCAATDSLYFTARSKYRQGELAESMEDLFVIVRSAEDRTAHVPDDVYSGTCLLLGNIYLGYGDNINASKFYERGIELAPDQDMELKFAYNLSLANCLLGHEDGARKYRDHLLSLDVSDTALWAYDAAVSEAVFEKSFGDPARSITMYKHAALLVDSLGMDSAQYSLVPLSELGEYYHKNDMLDSAAYWLSKYEEVAVRSHNPHIMADCQRNLMELYIKLGEREKALEYSGRYMATMDSMVNFSGYLKVASKREREREAAAAQRINNLEFTISKQKFLLVAILIIALCALAAWLVAKRLRGNMQQLFVRNREIAILEGGAPEPEKDSRENQWHVLMANVRSILADPLHFCDPDFSINTLARLCNSNTRYISQAINETTGDNFRALINGYRIREARRRLTSDPGFADLTIQSIGESVGFRSASNFINAFKKATGMTPSLYQRMTKANKE